MSKTLIKDGEIQDQYRSLIAKSRYSRWLDEMGRRETWEETVNRTVNHFAAQVDLTPDEKAQAKFHILNHNVLPSMRFVMTAGEAAERSNIAIFNCSHISIDDPRVFDEILYILTCGTGVGFSVTDNDVEKMPVVPKEILPSEEVILVGDSKEEWSIGYRNLISSLYRGELPKWDLRQIRPEGARLKTFGGRASGPAPLNDLFEFTVKLFLSARGRRLSTLDCHELVCKIASIVVMGSVRRSALISLSELDDEKMRDAKSGSWWEEKPHLALANNSAVYHRKPTKEKFDIEWKALVESGSGERGIFNLSGAKRTSPSRRSKKELVGTNPCLTGDARLMTENGWTTFADAYKAGTPNRIFQDGRITYSPSEDGAEHPEDWKVNLLGANSSVLTDASEVFLTQKDASVVKVNTRSGFSVRLTPDHLVATKSGMVEAGNLVPGDKILITRGHLPEVSIAHADPQTVEEHEAFLMGIIAGDGTFSVGKDTQVAIVDLWGEDRALRGRITGSIDALWDAYRDSVLPGGNRPFVKYNVTTIDSNEKVRIQSSFLAALLKKKYDFCRETKHTVPKIIWESARSTASLFYVKGLATADGTVNRYNKVGSSSIRINQSNEEMLSDIQQILLANGIVSSVYLRRAAGTSVLPDGRGGVAEYETKANYELVIMMNKFEYTKFIGFASSRKQHLAEEHSSAPSRKKNVFATVASVTDDGIEDVYCLKEESRRTLVANGIAMRRCGEILLRSAQFCNLSEVVVREGDTLEDLEEKVSFAAKMGTWQATFTNFPYIRDIWKKNTEEEALLGVSMTGTEGHPVLNGSEGREKQAEWLIHLRKLAVAVNRKVAKGLGINPAAAVTAVKPAGCRPWSAVTTTDEGILTLEEIFTMSGHKVGEKWHNADISTPTGRISKTYNNGVSEVMRISMHYGVSLESTPNHKWFVKGSGWTRTDEILPGDVIEWGGMTYTNKEESKLRDLDELAIHMRYDCAPKKKYPSEMTPDLAWFIGYLWGDGAQSPQKYRIRFSDENVFNLEKARDIALDLFGIDATIAESREGTQAATLELGSKFLWHWLIKNDIWKYYADNVDIIPTVIRQASQESIIAFFAGVNDADGWVGEVGGKGRFTITTSSQIFAKNLQDVSWAIGLNIYRSKNTQFGEGKLGDKPMYLLGSTSHTDPAAMKLFAAHSMKGRKVSGAWHTSENSRYNRTVGKVTGVVSLGKMNTYDAEVETSHEFFAGGFRSHNTTSQLTGTSSGLHAWYDHYFVRRIRMSTTDPICKFLEDAGLESEVDFYNDRAKVFSFPFAAPEGAVTRNDRTAIEQLENWLVFKEHWTEHNPSVTISVAEDEWDEVGEWVFEHFDRITGVSFLPKEDANHTYVQAPYESITKEQYESMAAKMPVIDWSFLPLYELEDTTTGMQELACVAGVCSVDSLIKSEDESDKDVYGQVLAG